MIASADSHLVEPPEMYVKYAARSWRTLAPQRSRAGAQGDVYTVDGLSLVLPISEILGGAARSWEDVPSAAWQRHARLDRQDTSGVDAELLFPTLGLFLCQHPDREYYDAFAWAYNRWLAEEWSGSERLGLVAMLGAHGEPRSWSKAVTFAGAHRMRGLLLPSEPSDGRWSDATYDSLFREMGAAGLVACFHAFSRPLRRGASRRSQAVFAAAHEAMDVLTELVVGGTLDRVQDLRVLFGEGETWWLGEWVRRMREMGCGEAMDRVRVTGSAWPDHGGEISLWADDYPHGAMRTVDPQSSADDLLGGVPAGFSDGAFWGATPGDASS